LRTWVDFPLGFWPAFWFDLGLSPFYSKIGKKGF
jgi:hypothetical protein